MQKNSHFLRNKWSFSGFSLLEVMVSLGLFVSAMAVMVSFRSYGQLKAQRISEERMALEALPYWEAYLSQLGRDGVHAAVLANKIWHWDPQALDLSSSPDMAKGNYQAQVQQVKRTALVLTITTPAGVKVERTMYLNPH